MWQRHRFYRDTFKPDHIILLEDSEIIHQCTKVLRLRPEDFVYFFNGIDPYDYKYKLQSIEKKYIRFKFQEKIKKHKNSKDIYLHQALPNKLSKLEYIVQKCCEVWIKGITFYDAHYSQTKNFLTDKKQERLKKICIESAEQSNRNSIPELVFEKKLNLSKIESENIICFHLEEKIGKKLQDLVIDKQTGIHLFVWPEWGYHESEIDMFHAHKAQFVCLWENILRTETVWVVSTFYISQHFS